MSFKPFTCRFCLSREGKHISLFDHMPKTKICLSLLASQLFDLNITKEDGVTSEICSPCFLKTCETYNFKLSCQRNEIALKELLNKTQPVLTDESFISFSSNVDTQGIYRENSILEQPSSPKCFTSKRKLCVSEAGKSSSAKKLNLLGETIGNVAMEESLSESHQCQSCEECFSSKDKLIDHLSQHIKQEKAAEIQLNGSSCENKYEEIDRLFEKAIEASEELLMNNSNFLHVKREASSDGKLENGSPCSAKESSVEEETVNKSPVSKNKKGREVRLIERSVYGKHCQSSGEDKIKKESSLGGSLICTGTSPVNNNSSENESRLITNRESDSKVEVSGLCFEGKNANRLSPYVMRFERSSESSCSDGLQNLDCEIAHKGRGNVVDRVAKSLFGGDEDRTGFRKRLTFGAADLQQRILGEERGKWDEHSVEGHTSQRIEICLNSSDKKVSKLVNLLHSSNSFENMKRDSVADKNAAGNTNKGKDMFHQVAFKKHLPSNKSLNPSLKCEIKALSFSKGDETVTVLEQNKCNRILETLFEENNDSNSVKRDVRPSKGSLNTTSERYILSKFQSSRCNAKYVLRGDDNAEKKCPVTSLGNCSIKGNSEEHAKLGDKAWQEESPYLPHVKESNISQNCISSLPFSFACFTCQNSFPSHSLLLKHMLMHKKDRQVLQQSAPSPLSQNKQNCSIDSDGSKNCKSLFMENHQNKVERDRNKSEVYRRNVAEKLNEEHALGSGRERNVSPHIPVICDSSHSKKVDSSYFSSGHPLDSSHEHGKVTNFSNCQSVARSLNLNKDEDNFGAFGRDDLIMSSVNGRDDYTGKNFDCWLCDQSFTSARLLLHHSKLHGDTSERPDGICISNESDFLININAANDSTKKNLHQLSTYIPSGYSPSITENSQNLLPKLKNNDTVLPDGILISKHIEAKRVLQKKLAVNDLLSKPGEAKNFRCPACLKIFPKWSLIECHIVDCHNSLSDEWPMSLLFVRKEHSSCVKAARHLSNQVETLSHKFHCKFCHKHFLSNIAFLKHKIWAHPEQMSV